MVLIMRAIVRLASFPHFSQHAGERVGPLFPGETASFVQPHGKGEGQNAERKLSARSELAEALRYIIRRRTALTRFATDARLEADNNIAENAIRGIATRRPLCPSSSSLWKHWNLIFEIGAIRATFSRERGGDPLAIQVAGADLVRGREPGPRCPPDTHAR